MSGTAQLLDECTIEETGLDAESNVVALMDLEGGKRKRKKKDYKGRPKKIKHKHRSRSKALLEYYNIETSGKVKKLKHECTKCEVGKFNHTYIRTALRAYPPQITLGIEQLYNSFSLALSRSSKRKFERDIYLDFII